MTEEKRGGPAMVDGIILFFVFAMFIVGFSRGALHQFWSLAVLAVATYLSGFLSPSLVGYLDVYIPNPVAARLVSFVFVFIVSGGLLNIARTWMGGRADETSDFADRSAGSVLGIVEAIGTIEVAAALLVTYPVLSLDTWITSSKVVGMLLDYAPVMLPLLPANFQGILLLFS
jgi:uncharacterized membrane protein required for colicin V production